MSILVTVLWPLLQRFWKPLAIVAAILAVFLYGYHKGDERRDRIWKAQIEAERKAQAAVISKVETKALAEAQRLNQELEDANAQINVLLAESDKDSNATRPAIGVGGVQRFNRIGPR